jgi:hypothetical protein
MADRAPTFGSQKMVIFDPADDSEIITLDAQTATSIIDSFSNRAAFTFTQTSMAVREALKDYFVKTNTSPVTLAYEDGEEADYYLGSSKVRSLNKGLKYIWYASDTEGGTTRVTIYGQLFVSGDTGKLDTSAGAPAASPVQIFPLTAIGDVTFPETMFDASLVTVITPGKTLVSGDASAEEYLTIPTS